MWPVQNDLVKTVHSQKVVDKPGIIPKSAGVQKPSINLSKSYYMPVGILNSQMFTNRVHILLVSRGLIVWQLSLPDAPLYQQVSDKGLTGFFGTKVRNLNVNHRTDTKEGGASAPILKFASAGRVEEAVAGQESTDKRPAVFGGCG